MQVSQRTPTDCGVLMKVLQAGVEHCVPVASVGFEVVMPEEVGVEERLRLLRRRLRAHSPALGQLWAVSDRWSRQYV